MALRKGVYTIQICLLLTLVFEVALATFLYRHTGDAGVSIITLRIFIQVIFLVGILLTNSRIPIYILTFYHVIIGLQFFTNDFSMLNSAFGLYHFVIGLLIYFNEEVDIRLKRLLS